MLPLATLLNVPMHNIIVVADNARSPAHPVSSSLKRPPSRRTYMKRAKSLDGKTLMSRWSSIQEENMVEQTSKIAKSSQSPNRRVAFMRSKSIDDMFRSSPAGGRGDQTSTPASIPVRRRSPPSSPRKKTTKEAKCNLKTGDGRKARGLDCSHVKDMRVSNTSLRKPIRQHSPPNLDSMTTDELLTMALAELETIAG
jgi:hypothetical protein